MGQKASAQQVSASCSQSPDSTSLQSEPTPLPPVPTLYDNPWRKFDETYQDLVDEITQINPKCAANVLLLGPTGAGKSSLINSILSITKGRRAYEAYTGTKDTSFTTSYGCFMQQEDLLKNCCLWDSMGIEQVLNGGILLGDLVYLLKGHVKKGYKFDPRIQIQKSDEHFRKHPRTRHQTHGVVFVLDSTTMDETVLLQYIQKIKSFQEGTKDLDIPCVLILTKIDRVCSEVRDDVSKTFRSIKVHNAVTTARDIFGFPDGNIHPVKNYEVEIDFDDNASNLILLALRQILYFAFDRIENLKRNKKRRCSVS